MARKRENGDRIGWADLTDAKVEGGCSPIVKGEIEGNDACYGPEGWRLIYDERTDTIYGINQVISSVYEETDPVEMVCATLEQYDEDEL